MSISIRWQYVDPANEQLNENSVLLEDVSFDMALDWASRNLPMDHLTYLRFVDYPK